eukprot:8596016-Pyramimonas_sp.AAC.1
MHCPANLGPALASTAWFSGDGRPTSSCVRQPAGPPTQRGDQCQYLDDSLVGTASKPGWKPEEYNQCAASPELSVQRVFTDSLNASSTLAAISEL